MIDSDLLASGDFAQIRAAAAVLLGLIDPGATVRRGDKVQAVKSFKEALDWLLADARDSVSLQRYKGLGEMNPGAALGNDDGSGGAPPAAGCRSRTRSRPRRSSRR